jgi:hypothetical protein
MFANYILPIYERGLDLASRLVADLSEEQMIAQPAPKMNHAAWIIGHVASVSAIVAPEFVLGLERTPFPAELVDRVSHSSSPQQDRSLYPSKAALMQLLTDSHARMAEVLPTISEAQLAGLPKIERFHKRFPTVGMALTHMLISHEEMHLGQLSAWRRAQGLPAV